MTFVERNAVVFDHGSYETKFGHAGTDLPAFVTPSTLFTDGQKVLRNVFKPLSTIEIKEDDYDELLNQAYGYMGLDMSEHALMIPDAPNTKERVALMDRLFEQVPCLYFCCRPVLSTFHAAKTNALVIDVGHKQTTVCAVHEGYHVKNSVQTSTLAGEFLSQYALDYLKKEYQYDPYPSLLVDKKPILEPGKLPDPENRLKIAINDKVKKQLQMDIMHVFKEHVFTSNSFNSVQVQQGRPFEFPDGYNRSFTKEPFITDLLFNPSSLNQEYQSIIKMVQASYDMCDNECKNLLPGNIVLTGGTSSINGFAERLEVLHILI
eukprot:NODE_124_length_18806_cov_0.323996.p6 type:complete len:320 gc:universal NODE_124_length_18806_cov_0.323996:15592-14633(-)